MDNLELTRNKTFDENKLRFGLPETADIKGNDGAITGQYYKCSLEYENSKGENIPLIMDFPKEFCYGVQPEYGYGKAKTEENMRGYNLCYYCSNPDTKTKHPPTPEQQTAIKNLNSIATKLATHLKESKDYLEETAGDLAESRKLVSPLARYPKKEIDNPNNPKLKKKIADTSKALRFYPRLIQSKNGTFISDFNGPGNKKLNPLDLVEKRGYITPAIKFEYVYIGTSTATIQIKLWECNYTPTESLQRKRLLEVNEDKLIVSEESDPNEDLKEEILPKEEDLSFDNEEELKPKPAPAPVPPKRTVKKMVPKPKLKKLNE